MVIGDGPSAGDANTTDLPSKDAHDESTMTFYRRQRSGTEDRYECSYISFVSETYPNFLIIILNSFSTTGITFLCKKNLSHDHQLFPDSLRLGKRMERISHPCTAGSTARRSEPDRNRRGRRARGISGREEGYGSSDIQYPQVTVPQLGITVSLLRMLQYPSLGSW